MQKGFRKSGLERRGGLWSGEIVERKIIIFLNGWPLVRGNYGEYGFRKGGI